MFASKKIQDLFFVNYDEIRKNRKNKICSRLSKMALWIYVILVVPIAVRFSIEISSCAEIYNPTRKGWTNVLFGFNFIVPLFAFMGFVMILILYSSDLYNGKKAAVFSWVISVVSLADTYLVCNIFTDPFVHLVILSVSIFTTLFLFFNTPGLVKSPRKVSTVISRVILVALILFAIMTVVYKYIADVDMGNFFKIIYDLFMKGGG